MIDLPWHKFPKTSNLSTKNNSKNTPISQSSIVPLLVWVYSKIISNKALLLPINLHQLGTHIEPNKVHTHQPTQSPISSQTQNRHLPTIRLSFLAASHRLRSIKTCMKSNLLHRKAAKAYPLTSHRNILHKCRPRLQVRIPSTLTFLWSLLTPLRWRRWLNPSRRRWGTSGREHGTTAIPSWAFSNEYLFCILFPLCYILSAFLAKDKHNKDL